MGFGIFGTSFFTALNDGLAAGILSATRTLVIEMSCIFILPMLFGYQGVWWASVVAELLSAIVASVFFISLKNKYHYA